MCLKTLPVEWKMLKMLPAIADGAVMAVSPGNILICGRLMHAHAIAWNLAPPDSLKMSCSTRLWVDIVSCLPLDYLACSALGGPDNIDPGSLPYFSLLKIVQMVSPTDKY